MTFAQYLNSHFTVAQYLDFILRLIVSCFCGAAIGIERAKRLKEAGIRTHVIVCCASALTMIISKYAFADMTDAAGVLFAGVRGADASRIAAQTISGISFLGAGVIFKHGSSVRGLTTAAGIWATAGIGLAVGAGMYLLGILATAIITITQLLMHHFTFGNDSMQTTRLQFTALDEPGLWDRMGGYFHTNHLVIVKTEIKRMGDGTLSYDIYVRSSQAIDLNQLTDYIHDERGILSASCTPLF